MYLLISGHFDACLKKRQLKEKAAKTCQNLTSFLRKTDKDGLAKPSSDTCVNILEEPSYDIPVDTEYDIIDLSDK